MIHNKLKKTRTAFENKYSTRADDVPMTILHLFLKPLTHVVNSSLISSTFPTQLRIVQIKPIWYLKKDTAKIVSLTNQYLYFSF